MFLLHLVCPPTSEGLREECQHVVSHKRKHDVDAAVCRREIQATDAQTVDEEMEQGTHSRQSDAFVSAELEHGRFIIFCCKST